VAQQAECHTLVLEELSEHHLNHLDLKLLCTLHIAYKCLNILCIYLSTLRLLAQVVQTPILDRNHYPQDGSP
jgi:hypothetical protein